MEALEARTSQMYHPPSLNDLVYNFMRDQHMMVRWYLFRLKSSMAVFDIQLEFSLLDKIGF